MNENENHLLDTKDEQGLTVSPVLPEGMKNYLIDIDGTICDDIPNEEPERMATAQVYPDALKTLNRWYDQGHVICFFTSRVEAHRSVTEQWLAEHGFDPLMGARPMARVIQENIKRRLAEEILFGELSDGGHVDVDVVDDELTFEFSGSQGSTPQLAEAAADD